MASSTSCGSDRRFGGVQNSLSLKQLDAFILSFLALLNYELANVRFGSISSAVVRGAPRGCAAT